MHIVLLNVILLDRTERAEADVQRHIADAHTLRLYFLQQFRRKVQPRRRRGRAALDLGIDRLIALLIGKLLLDVGRQRHLAEALERFKEDALVIEPYHAVSVRQHIHDLRRQLTAAKLHFRALAQMLARTHDAFPGLLSAVDEQQHLARAAARQTLAEKSRRQHAGVVQDQAIAGP